MPTTGQSLAREKHRMTSPNASRALAQRRRHIRNILLLRALRAAQSGQILATVKEKP